FGASVALDGTTAIVGAPTKAVGSEADEGVAYVFAASGAAWSQQAKLTASDGAKEDGFGGAGAGSASPGGGGGPVGGAGEGAGPEDKGRGAAYVCVQSASSWPQRAKLVATGGASGDNFGSSVATRGGTAVIGARSKGDIGAAYVFSKASTWKQQAALA